jgi:hypothetical protein
MSLGDLLFASGFDSQDPGIFDISNNGTFQTSNLRTALSTAKLRGNPSVQAALRDSAGAVASVSEVVFGFGFRTNTQPQNYVLKLVSPNGTDNLRVVLNSGHHIAIWRGDDTVLASGTALLADTTWYWIWGYVKISDTVGVVRTKINGVADIATTTSLDTRNDAGANGDKLSSFIIGVDTNYDFDDLYIQDATGTTNNGDDIDIGEVTIPYLTPDSAGDTTGMTPSAGSNFQCVDESPPNDDTDYVSAATSGTLDLYNLTSVSGISAVKGVVVRNRMKKDLAGAKNARSILKTGGTVSNGSDIALGTTYSTYPRNLRKNPVTAADFTGSEIDALQVGQEART